MVISTFYAPQIKFLTEVKKSRPGKLKKETMTDEDKQTDMTYTGKVKKSLKQSVKRGSF